MHVDRIQKSGFRMLAIMSGLFVFLALAAHASAATNWINGGNDASWKNVANWNTASVPASVTDVIIQNQPTANTIGVDTSVQVNAIKSLTLNNTLTAPVSVVPFGVEALQVNGGITNASGYGSTFRLGVISGANATYAGGAAGLSFKTLDVKACAIATTGAVAVTGSLVFDINSTTSYGSIGTVNASGATISFGGTYTGTLGEHFDLTTGSFAGATVDWASLPTLNAGLMWDYSNFIATGTLNVVSVNETTTATASYIQSDTYTQGNWLPAYGHEGYWLSQDAKNLPSYATVTIGGNLNHTWASNTTDVRALQRPDGLSRLATCWYSSTTYTMDVNLTDGKTHQVALYALDWDHNSRIQTISILDAATGVELATPAPTVSNFDNGTYLIWKISGHVLIKVTHTGGTNAVIGGIFFDPTGNTASYIHADTSTQGNWLQTYGQDGYWLSQSTKNLPPYAAVTVSGNLNCTWNSNTTDLRALQKPDGLSSGSKSGG